jgi:3-hydroxyacyl-[acyl-carrier-protein] dehydratase
MKIWSFYKGHLKILVTPGVILTETMAQIGLVCLGIFILDNNFNQKKTA